HAAASAGADDAHVVDFAVADDLHGAISGDCSLEPPADGKEQSALVAERRHPAELREPSFETPVVAGRGEQITGLIGEQRAWIRPNVLDAVAGEPALDFRERMTMLLGMLILIAQPRVAPRGLAGAIPQHRIEGNVPVVRRARDDAPQPERNARERIVEPEHD